VLGDLPAARGEVGFRSGSQESRKQGNKQTRKQGDKETSRQADKQTSRQADKQYYQQDKQMGFKALIANCPLIADSGG